MARLTTQPSIVAQTADEGQPGSVGSMPNNSASSSSTAPPAVTAATAATSTGSTTVATAAGTALGLAGGVASGADGVSGGGEKGVGLASVGQQLLLQCSLQCFPGGQGVGADAGLTDGIPGGLQRVLWADRGLAQASVCVWGGEGSGVDELLELLNVLFSGWVDPGAYLHMTVNVEMPGCLLELLYLCAWGKGGSHQQQIGLQAELEGMPLLVQVGGKHDGGMHE
eukprot:1158322-Pelagomonas_calceolata.AAC.10